MHMNQLIWQTAATAMLVCEQDGYVITVERLLPGDEARFVVRDEADLAVPRASGVESSVMGAIVAATNAVRALSIERAETAGASDDRSCCRVSI
jgi:hypothetical protein